MKPSSRLRARSSASAFAIGVGLAAALAPAAAKADEPLAPLPAPGASASTGAPAASADPSTATPVPAEARPDAEAEAARKMRFAFRGAGGFQYARVFGVPITGARLRLGVGGQNDKSGHYGSLSVQYAETENDLRTWDVRFGWIGDFYRASIVRLGIDMEVGYLVIRRATIDARMWALGAGAGVHAGFDLYSFGPRGDHAITAEARFDGHLHFGGGFMWGPSVLLGFRY